MRPYPPNKQINKKNKNREGEKGRQGGRLQILHHRVTNFKTLGKVLLDGAAQEGCELQAEEFGLSGVEPEGALSRTKARVSQG